MKKIYTLSLLAILLLSAAFLNNGFAQPSTTRYWVGPASSNFNGVNWSTTSGGGSPAASTGNINTQYVFDGAGTANQTYTVTLDVLTLGFFTVKNNTTVILKSTTTSGTTTYDFCGYSIEAGSKLVVENASASGTLRFSTTSTSYQSTVNGELEARATSSTTQLDFANFALGTTCDIFGTIRTTGAASSASISASATKLNFKANSNLIINTDNGTSFTANCDPTMTVTITGAGVAGSSNSTASYLTSFSSWGNVVYNCPNQTVNRPLFGGGGWTVKGNLTIVSTGTAKLNFLGTGTSSANSILGNMVLQSGNAPKMGFYGAANPATATTITINGNLDVQAGSSLDMSSAADGTNGFIVLKGNLTNNGTINETGSSTGSQIELAGTAVQSIAAVTPFTDDISIKLNNAAGFNLLSNLSMSPSLNAVLNMLKGVVAGNSNTIILNNPNVSALAGGADTCYLSAGVFRRTTGAAANYLFPIGNGRYAPLYLIPATGAGNTMQASYTATGYGTYNVSAPLDHVSKKEWWQVQRVSGSDAMEVGLQVNNFTFSGVNINRNILSFAANTGGPGWTELSNGQITDIVAGSSFWIKATGVTNFTAFTLGDRIAISSGGNGLGDITGISDPTPAKELGIALLYPNPSTGNIQFSINSKYSGKADIRLVDINGRVLENSSVNLLPGSNQMQMNVGRLSKGTYIIRISNNKGQTASEQFVRL